MATINAINSNIPIEIAKGGTNATSMTNTDGVVYYDGTRLVTTAVGTATNVLTSNGAGVAPTFQALPAGGVTSITSTANQITASASTGAVTLSIPSTFTSPGSVTATTNFVLPTSSSTAGKLIIDGSVFLIGQTSVLSTFLGRAAGNTSLSGSSNTGVGYTALTAATTASQCCAFGASAQSQVQTGTQCNAFGTGAQSGTTAAGGQNNAMGYIAQQFVTGSENTGIGHGCQAAGNPFSGSYNTAVGSNAMASATTAAANVAIGRYSMNALTQGANNVGIGYNGLQVTTGSNNVCVGYQAGTAYTTSEGGNVILGGAQGTAAESNKTRIGYIGNAASQTGCFIDGITGVVAGTAPVLVAATGQLGVAASSERFKTNINDMGSESNAMMSLRPVTFNWKENVSGAKSFGLIAEEVRKVLPELVELDKEGLPFSVRYHELPAMLLNELIKMNKRIEELERQLRIGKMYH